MCIVHLQINLRLIWGCFRFDGRTLTTCLQVSALGNFEAGKILSANTLFSKVKAAFAVPNFAPALA